LLVESCLLVTYRFSIITTLRSLPLVIHWFQICHVFCAAITLHDIYHWLSYRDYRLRRGPRVTQHY
jgi:hypothetical protein